MPTTQVTIDDIKRILRQCAGEADDVDLESDILDIEFQELGYDSLAMLELSSQISHEYGITLDDDVTISARTPRALLNVVNR
jgi:minimal PKS acyl carrier protein